MEKYKYLVSLFALISISETLHKVWKHKGYKLLNSCLGIFVFSLSSLVFAEKLSDSVISLPSTVRLGVKVIENKSADNKSSSIGRTNTLLDDVSSAVTNVSKSDIEHVPSTKFDWTKQPPVTKGPRPGGFVVPPSPKATEYPKHWSLWDFVTQTERETKPTQPYAPFALQTTPASDIDFSYLENPDHEKDFFDPLKRIHIGDDILFSMGGQFWYRYMHEGDSRLNSLKINNTFHLTRLRFHGDLWYQDKIRLFAEFLDARMWGNELTPLGIDRNHTDMLSIFMDVKLAEAQGGKAYVRVGRQELTFGSQRLISSLDWVNTRRTFQGAKVFWHTPKFNLDTFWVRPMMTQPNAFDQWQKKRDFVGLWGTYKPQKGHEADLYFLSLLDNRNRFVGQGGVLGDSEIHTIGSRYI